MDSIRDRANQSHGLFVSGCFGETAGIVGHCANDTAGSIYMLGMSCSPFVASHWNVVDDSFRHSGKASSGMGAFRLKNRMDFYVVTSLGPFYFSVSKQVIDRGKMTVTCFDRIPDDNDFAEYTCV